MFFAILTHSRSNKFSPPPPSPAIPETCTIIECSHCEPHSMWLIDGVNCANGQVSRWTPIADTRDIFHANWTRTTWKRMWPVEWGEVVKVKSAKANAGRPRQTVIRNWIMEEWMATASLLEEPASKLSSTQNTRWKREKVEIVHLVGRNKCGKVKISSEIMVVECGRDRI